MLRWLALAAGLAFVFSACALDVRGLEDEAVDAGGVLGPRGDGAAVGSPDDGGPGTEAAPAGGGQDATGSPAPDADGESDAAGAFDASGGGPASGDAAPEAGSPCDEDGDGHLAANQACGGDDCCDQDPHVHPGQTSYFASPGACGGFDYDCDGKESKQYDVTSCKWSTFSCSGDGFAAPVPTCGAFGTFTSCNIPWYNVFSCSSSDAQQAQACR